MESLPEAGADIIELGIPFSDPMADGPVIQAAGQRALKEKTTVNHVLKMVTTFRKKDQDTPIILMGYYNPLYHRGVQDFCEEAVKCGADGLIIVDVPYEEEATLQGATMATGLDLIRLIAPTTKDERLHTLLRDAKGFVYYIAVAGITGSRSAHMQELSARMDEIRTHTTLPVAVGFGIKTPAQAKEVAHIADGVVVGSALVEKIHTAVNTGHDPVNAAKTFVQALREGMS